MSVTIHEGTARPDDVLGEEDPEVRTGGCVAETGNVEDYLGDGAWLLCWRPRDHGGVHWDDADKVAWTVDDEPVAVPA